jgi:serine/threonine-protein kinase ULK2
MPKLIDNYVLSRKIGAGQYGEVFKGYDRATNNDIAVKSIRREGVKGTACPIQGSSRSCWRARLRC